MGVFFFAGQNAVSASRSSSPSIHAWNDPRLRRAWEISRLFAVEYGSTGGPSNRRRQLDGTILR